MIQIDVDNIVYKERLLLNGYSGVNETSQYAIPSLFPMYSGMGDSVFLDDNYGRFYDLVHLNSCWGTYGRPNMPFYNHGACIKLPVVDEFHVPYRRIPVYKIASLSQIRSYLHDMQECIPDQKILLRGQNQSYELQRKDSNEYMQFYAAPCVKEPSFLPSMARRELNYYDTVSVWHNLSALLLERLKKKHPKIDETIRLTERFHLLSLAIAQHYGLPSVGLDLTDDPSVALWFALYKAKYSSSKPVSATLVEETHDTANIYVFRCDSRTYFKFTDVVGDIGMNRPTAQHAYFNHCGWGLSKNQLALQLICAFRVNRAMANELSEDYIHTLFPKKEDDDVLQALLEIRDMYIDTPIAPLLNNIYL